MAAHVATAEPRTTSIGKASWRALAASWLGWMFDGYESYALVLVMTPAVRPLLSPEKLPKASIYAGGLLAATLLGWAAGGVAAGVLAVRPRPVPHTDKYKVIDSSLGARLAALQP